MHPVIDAALVQHSAVFGNAMARLGPFRGAHHPRALRPDRRRAQMVRDMHKDIKGTTDAGRRYHALTPDRTPGRTPRSCHPVRGCRVLP
ncbi:oxygenase MpaB family protein [Rhodococcus opacus]|uniref:oxygenase MpaB family protein n=1 Tax=Rhodococcus opacus TaxID=37919 RepID=UPI001B300FA7